MPFHPANTGHTLTRAQLETQQVPIYFAAVLVAVTFGLLASDTARHLQALVTPAIAVLMYACLLYTSPSPRD